MLDKAHSLRNLAEYEGKFDADGQLITDLVNTVEIVLAEVKKLGPIRKE